MSSSLIPHPPPLKTYAVIPVKPLRQAKRRLARALKPPLRQALVRSLLSRTLDLLNANARIAGIIVISHDVTVLELARNQNAIGLAESESGLNAAITQAATWARDHGAQAIFIVPTDLPLMTQTDINAMFDLATGPKCVVIAPDRREAGTNALLVRPPDAIVFAYGTSSFEAHCHQAQDRNLPVYVYRSPTLALDLDVPDDLAFFQEGAAKFDLHSLSE
jgi:2-phospho-L-lactate/phosphoenolpyruvate guanylyltransferase